KQDGNAIRKLLDRQEVTPIDLRAVGRICIDVLWRVVLTKQPVSIPPIAMARDSDDISMTTRPLALDADEAGAKIEDQVVALDGERAPNADPEVRRRLCIRELCDCAFLICREHVGDASGDLGWAVSKTDNLRPRARARTFSACRCARCSLPPRCY